MTEVVKQNNTKNIGLGQLNKAELSALLPHSGDMCLLNSVVDWNEVDIECLANSHTESGNPLRHQGQLSIMAGIEYAAQAMAIHGTLRTGKQAVPRMGMLAVLSKVVWYIQRLDQLKNELSVRASQVNELDQGASYQFSLYCDGRLLLQGEAVIALM